MTQLLIRLFIRHSDNPQDPHTRAAYGNLASIVGMVCNVLLCLGKLAVGTLFGSIAIMADALNNLSDASSNIVSLVGFKLASRAPDAEHPFGHARYEYLAGLVVSVTVLGIGFSLLKESVVKVLHPTAVQFSLLTVAVLVASILVKLWMSSFNRTIGRTIGSETLIATAADSRNDVLSTGAVLIATILCRLTGWNILDGLMGVGVAVFILISGWGLVMDTLSPLLGERNFMKNDHLMVTIHYDPIVTSDAAVGVLRTRLTEKLRQLNPALSLHDLRIVPGKTHTNVLFDLVLPAGYAGDKVELLTQMEQFIKEQDPTYNCIIKVEQSYTAAHQS